MQKQIALEIEGNSLVPPHSNTGAQSTGQRILIDWFAFTIPHDEDIWEVLRIPLVEWVAIPTRSMGYTVMYLHGAMKVYMSDEREDMGKHCELSGAACREYEFFLEDDWKGLVERVKAHRGHFSRIDLAVDDFDGVFSLDEVEHKVRSGEVVSCFSRGKVLQEYNLGAVDNLGKTVYFGSSKSRVQIRMYDKAIEQLVKDQKSRDVQAVEEESKDRVPASERKERKKNREERYRRERLECTQVWNRTEIQSRDERACAVADYLDSGVPLGLVLFGVLKNYLRFVERSEQDTNRSRWEESGFWSEFLGAVEKLRLSVAKGQRTIKQVKEWLVRQVAPSLALLSLGKDLSVNLEEVCKMAIWGVNRLKKSHYAMIAAS